MSQHLTEQDMRLYAEIDVLTPESLEVIAQIHQHVYACEECQIELELYCRKCEELMQLMEQER